MGGKYSVVKDLSREVEKYERERYERDKAYRQDVYNGERAQSVSSKSDISSLNESTLEGDKIQPTVSLYPDLTDLKQDAEDEAPKTSTPQTSLIVLTDSEEEPTFTAEIAKPVSEDIKEASVVSEPLTKNVDNSFETVAVVTTPSPSQASVIQEGNTVNELDVPVLPVKKTSITLDSSTQTEPDDILSCPESFTKDNRDTVQTDYVTPAVQKPDVDSLIEPTFETNTEESIYPDLTELKQEANDETPVAITAEKEVSEDPPVYIFTLERDQDTPEPVLFDETQEQSHVEPSEDVKIPENKIDESVEPEVHFIKLSDPIR